ncbi:MAG: diguanylate cyclase [Myxococcota bacterium]
MTPNVPNPNRVLVIDDSDFIHKLVRMRLRREGLKVSSEYSGKKGIDRSVHDRPDLILLDIDLPDLDGFDVCQRLKEYPETRNIPVIFLTGTVTTEAKVRGLDLGAVDYVTKPFDEVELRARVRAALRTKRLQDILEKQSFVDGLTGLWNRSYMDRRLESELKVATRYERRLSLVMADIDHFKQLNDTHGHLFGDIVLQGVAGALREVARQSDVVCRFGGEEFVLLLTDTPLQGGIDVAERLRQAVESKGFEVCGQILSVTASFGVATTDRIEEPLSTEALLSAADQALYSSKQNGRNCVHAFGLDGIERVSG